MPKTLSTIYAEIASELPDNTTRQISPLDARTRLVDITDWHEEHRKNSWKRSARVRGSSNISIATAPPSIDSITLSAGDRILLTAQTTATENGLWQFASAGTALVRPLDFAFGDEAGGTFVVVRSGTSANKSYKQTVSGAVGSISQTWVDTETVSDTNVREKIAELPPATLNGTGSTISSSNSATNTSNLIDGNDTTSMSFVSSAGQTSHVTVALGTPISAGNLSSVELTNALLQTSNPPGDLYLDLCDSSGNCITSYFFGDRVTTVGQLVRISVGMVQFPITSIRLRQFIASGNHGALRVGELKLVNSAIAGDGTIRVLQQFNPATGAASGNYFYLDVPWTPPGGTSFRDPDRIDSVGGGSSAAGASYTSVLDAAARKSQSGLLNGHTTFETSLGLMYRLIDSANINLDASWVRVGPHVKSLINGNFAAGPVLPAAQVGEWLRVGTRGVVSGGVTWYEGEWYQANQDTAGSSDGSTRTHWTLTKPDIEFRDKGYYNPTTNSPVLTDATGREQERYIVTPPIATQTRDFGSGNIIFPIGITGELIHKSGIWSYRKYGDLAPEVIYSAAHGLLSGDIGKPIQWSSDGKPKVVTSTNESTGQMVGVLREILDINTITMSTAFKVGEIDNALLPSDKLNYGANTNDRLYTWNSASGVYEHADPGESEAVYYIGASLNAGKHIVLILDMPRGGLGGSSGGGSGEVNTASNIGSAGVGLWHSKNVFDLRFRNVAAGSSKITVVQNNTNNTADVDVSEPSLTLDNIGGTLSISKGGTGAINKTTAFNNLGPATSQGDLTIHNGTNNVRFPKGTAGQILRTNLAGATLEWFNAGSFLQMGLYTVSASDATNQRIILPSAPSSLNSVIIFRNGLIPSLPTIHFTTTGTATLLWIAGAGDPPLESGEFLFYIYAA
jgi:hypothetical protein